MFLTRKQVEKLSKAFQENPEANLVIVKDEPNGSGIGPDTFAHFYREVISGFKKPTRVFQIDITDTDLW